ncbi:23S rRNA (adenine(1618)-N(6))-methyltransferase RlmF [Paraglaciecola sp.]|uniref:23S rRNA (adenine(1618)-N(6))-methyltransferase RlmF n=1 Tax=Paraglaciecola sp. TaxID=1920173 RepID=UPI003EFB1AE7
MRTKPGPSRSQSSRSQTSRSQPRRLHPRSLHLAGYPLEDMAKQIPALTAHLIVKPDGSHTVNFSDPLAVKALNAALLEYYYQIRFWDIPAGYLCPPIPGRADYVHYIADLLADDSPNENSKKQQIKGLDIGTGANLIYPILANRIYAWNMLATDIDPISIKSANTIVTSNPELRNAIKIKQQNNPKSIFNGVIEDDDVFDFCMCNPPFHASAKEAKAGSERKVNNLSKHAKKRQSKFVGNQKSGLNFAGQGNELWCVGGELAFIRCMIEESHRFARQIKWFTCLISKKENVTAISKTLEKINGIEFKVVNMAQGQKVSRFIAWRFNSNL